MNVINPRNPDVPKPKDYLNLEHWALINNLYAHPAYMKAVNNRNKMIAVASSVGTVLLLALIMTVLELLF